MKELTEEQLDVILDFAEKHDDCYRAICSTAIEQYKYFRSLGLKHPLENCNEEDSKLVENACKEASNKEVQEK